MERAAPGAGMDGGSGAALGSGLEPQPLDGQRGSGSGSGSALTETETGTCALPRPDNGARRKINTWGCEVCGATESKYRCPQCTAVSCSLPCVKRHKAERACSGVRDKTAFTSLGDFTEMQLVSDYRFLEDAGRLVGCALRDRLVHLPTTNRTMNFLKNRARRNDINLKLLPIGFAKRVENSTAYYKKEQLIYWHVKLVFPQSSTTYTERRVAENKTLEQILNPYIHPQESDPVTRQRLKVYVLAPPGQVSVLLQVEGGESSSPRYHRLDVSRSLAENLRHKTVIEYPTLLMVLKARSTEYRLLRDSDSSEDGESETGSSSKNEMEEEKEVGDLVTTSPH